MPIIEEHKVNHLLLNTNDKDLAKLAGYYAYKQNKKESYIDNGRYKIVDLTNPNQNQTGLNAMTVKNVATGEYTVIFQGTNPKQLSDLLTDVNLLGDVEPDQLKAASHYFDQMNRKYGVSSVCGNSLGGALANVVGISHPKVKTVTLNPAILPGGMVDPNQEYSNINNYFSKYDPLTLGEESLQLSDRFPGNIYRINSGAPYLKDFLYNHLGYGEDQTPESVEIGNKGEPGYGRIYIAADDHIVTSIWTGQPLYGGGGSGRIEINKDALETLADALQSQVLDHLKREMDYTRNANIIVESEKKQRANRLAKLQKQFEDILENAAGNSPLYKGITSGGYVISGVLGQMAQKLYEAEMQCHSLQLSIFSPPQDYAEYFVVKDLGLEGMLSQSRQFLNDIKMHFENLSRCSAKILKQVVPQLLASQAKGYADAVVDEIFNHEVVVGKNNQRLYNQIDKYRKQVRAVGSHFQSTDESLAKGIQNGGSPRAGHTSVTGSKNGQLATSTYLVHKMSVKSIQVEHALTELSDTIRTLLTPIVNELYLSLFAMEQLIEGLSSAIKIVGRSVWYVGIPTTLISLFTNWDDQLNSKINRALKPVDDLAESIHSVRTGINHLNANLPGLVMHYRPYIVSAVFNNQGYANVIAYNSAAVGILEEMELLFQDIVRQLSAQKGQSITALYEHSKSILKNVKLLHSDVARGTL
ncbi:hypothetical protein E4665_03025 [Sporolactobacillus shoreae]|uniref:Uncharacterized protein n=1 Tax=Sporolactobacillus shoreae TaxID=1465501 RepID=A0A4Z0GRY6_9BACL|nr:hypothetical protein [Sporolactobacillus shoreae]TGA99935.1 hypothetical protein E4665_03025 [Sporolactobacillus shoreae]